MSATELIANPLSKSSSLVTTQVPPYLGVPRWIARTSPPAALACNYGTDKLSDMNGRLNPKCHLKNAVAMSSSQLD